MKVHEFKTETSEEVYNLTQCDESIQHGDILVLHAEKIVGILDEAWPVAITVAHGEFHGPLDPQQSDNYRFNIFPEAVPMAEEICRENQWPIGIEPPF